jgi:UDP-3-O-[3-hydroxymyristoyl] glucosamine N-acyltransferase
LSLPELGVVEIAGNADIEIVRAVALDRAGAGALLFCKAETMRSDEIAALEGCAVICRAGLADQIASERIAALVTDNPRLTFMRLVDRFFPPVTPPPGIHSAAFVDPSATVDPAASVGAFAVIGPGCTIGAGTVIHAHAVLYADVRVGREAVVHAGAVIGADGFGYERRPDGGLEKFPHLGGVVIEDRVEVGSNTSIDRGSLGDTILRRGCKIDNQVHIAHNVDVGEDAVVIAQSMVGGSVKIGARAWLAPAAVVMNQIEIGPDATVGLGAVVTKAVAPGQTVMGAPASDAGEFKAVRGAIKRLVEGAAER